MTYLEFLYLALGIGFLVLVGFLSHTLFQVSKTIKEIRPVLEDIRDIADDVRSAKDGIKFGFESLAQIVASFIPMKKNREEVARNDRK